MTDFNEALIDEVRSRVFARDAVSDDSVARQRRNVLKLMRAVDEQRVLNRPDSVIRAILLDACVDDMVRRGLNRGQPRFETEYDRASLAIEACLALITSGDTADDA